VEHAADWRHPVNYSNAISTLLFGTSAMMLIIASRFAKITVEV